MTFTTIKGEYLPEIITAGGGIIRPFGDKPLNNLILDSFFTAVLTGYPFGIQAFMQSCRAGDSATPAQRTDTGILGNQTGLTHASTIFNVSAEQNNNRLYMSRDFVFAPVTSETSYREACVGSFGIQRITDITVSRFVFPDTVTLLSGDSLKINYTLYMTLNTLFTSTAIPTLSSPTYNLNFSGIIRSTSDQLGLVGQLPGAVIGLGNDLTFMSGAGAIPSIGEASYVYRTFTQNTTSTNAATTNGYGKVNHIFSTRRDSQATGTGSGGSTITGSVNNSIGFYTSAHTPAVFPNIRNTFTAEGPVGSQTLSNLQLNNSYASIDASYYFPSHTASRTANGVYLWRNSSANSTFATYLSFYTPQTIPANTPVEFKLRWYFTR